MDRQIITDDILENGSDAVDGLENNFDETDGLEIIGNGKKVWFREKYRTIKSISVSKGGDEICIVVDEKLQFLNMAGSRIDSDSRHRTLSASYISSQNVLLTTCWSKTASNSTQGQGRGNDTRGSSSETVIEVWTLSRPSNKLTQVTTSQMKMPRFSSSHDDVIYLADQKSGVLTSRDEGRTWQRLMLQPDPELGGLWSHWCVAAVGHHLFCVGNRFNGRSVVTLYYRVTSSASSKPEEDTYELERFINADTLGLATFTPTHLIGDSKGHVIVADKNNAVHVFNSRGDYIKMLLNKEEHGIIQPCCLALSHDEKTLYVAQNKSNYGVIDTFPYDSASFLT